MKTFALHNIILAILRPKQTGYEHGFTTLVYGHQFCGWSQRLGAPPGDQKANLGEYDRRCADCHSCMVAISVRYSDLGGARRNDSAAPA